jgi:isopenicillin-N epimerase
MASVPLPPARPKKGAGPLAADPLQEQLLERHGIEVPVIPWPAPPKRLLRISAQLYNEPRHYQFLADRLRELLSV